MRKIIALSGWSGVGKTYRRTTDPALKDLPYVDIADVYAEYPNPWITNRQVFAFFLDKVEELIENDADTVVLEAYFRPASYQRDWLEYLAERHDCQLEYIELTAPLPVCAERIKKQYQDFLAEPGHAEGEIARMKRFTNARLEILRSYGSCA